MHHTWLAYFLLFTAMLLFFACQYRHSKKQRQRLSRCILVNGTRGKSSVTRLITAGLRAGLTTPVLGKTTGTQAMWLLPDGTEETICRHAPANIREMAEGLARAEQLGAETYVAECMAVMPEYQSVIERCWMRSTITVLTNIRPDHEDVYGEGLNAVAKGLSASLPQSGILVTTAEAAALLGTVCSFPQEKTVLAPPALGQEWLPQFTEPIVPENLAMALTVCRLAGVAPEVAVTGMLTATADPGNLEVLTVPTQHHALRFIGAFAANDALSTLQMAEAHAPAPGVCKGIWLHARADRRQRTVSLCAALQTLTPDFAIFSGDIDFLRRHWPATALPLGSFALPMQAADELEAVIKALPEQPVWLFGAGNTKGILPQRVGGEVLCRKLSWAY